jgi:hypothetical protein
MKSIADITVEQKAALRKVVDTLRKEAPSMFCGLNVAQYRALKAMYTLDSASGHPPALNIVSFANGVGKSHLMILDMIGWTVGYEYLNYEVFPVEALAFYNSLKPLRDAGKLSLRLTCDANDLREGGSVLKLLAELFPIAKVVNKDQQGTYRDIVVPHPDIKGIENHIAVRTFDQAVVKHSGSTLHRVWINEPIPQHLIGETIGRIRSKSGKTQGAVAMFATLLDDAGWVDDLEDGDSLRVSHTRGHLYENCEGSEVTDAMAAEVKKTIGVTLQRNQQGGGYLTNGILSKASIDGMIHLWRATSPSELEARKCGAPISGGGRIYPTFNKAVHVIDEVNVNPSWPVLMVADPHSARPAFVIWAQVMPSGRVVIFDEYPSDVRYETVDERRHTVEQECEVWTRIEQLHGIVNSPITRIGDPNRFREPQVYTGQTLQALYAKHGFSFNTNVSDDLAVGHAKVNEYLYFDEMRLSLNKDDPAALPNLFVAKKCQNVIRALEKYAFKKGRRAESSVTENVNQKYKDPADCVRYAVVYLSMKSYSEMSDREVGSSDYKKFCEGRTPAAYRQKNGGGYGFKNRRVA